MRMLIFQCFSWVRLQSRSYISKTLYLVKYETNPKEIITSSKMDTRLMEALPARCTLKLESLIIADRETVFDDEAFPYPVKTLKSSEYVIDLCRARLLRLELPGKSSIRSSLVRIWQICLGMPKGLSAYDREAYLARDIDFESHQLVKFSVPLLINRENNICS